MEVRHGTQHSQLLNRLMCRAVFAYADTVMSQNVCHRHLHQRRQSCHRLHVIAEYEEGSHIWNHSAMKGQTVSDSCHSLLSYAEMQVLAAVILFGEISRTF